MALESASYISQLNVANPLSTDTVSQADDHLRLIKSVLKNTFPNLSSPVTATAAQLNNAIPSGFIGLWSGAISAVPGGWFLCDGTNGTPNLRDRFVVGAGDSYVVGAIGGAASVTLTESQIPTHTHTVTATTAAAGAHNHTVTDPGHTHSYNQAGGAAPESGTGFVGYQGYNTLTGTATTSATTGISLASAADHTHTITATAGNTGGGGSHENRPPYYALAYIMKA